MEEFCFVRIQIFRQRIRRHGATAKGDHLFARRQDRKHDAVAETIIGDRHVLMHDKATGLHLLLGDPLGRKMLFQRIAAFRRIAQPEGLDGASAKPSIAQIGTRSRPCRRLQLILEKQGRHFHDVLKRRPFTLAPFGLHIRLRHGNARHIGNLLHGLRKGHAVEVRQEAKMIAGNATAEAMVTTLAILAVETRALFAMERAAGPEVALRGIALLPVPRHAFADDIGDVHPVAYLVEEGV